MPHPELSFEFFPPKSEEAATQLWSALGRLSPLAPRFVSVTYGAGGSTRERTHATVRRILADTMLVPAAHLTAVAATRDEVNEVARDYWRSGVRHIVALRGDPPGNLGGTYTPHPDGYADAAALVAGLRRVGDFEISVAAYPETHPEAPSPAQDLDNLKRKLDAGASRAITQCFFDADRYFRFVERARRAGITVPIVPGILPVTDWDQLRRFAQRCGAHLPPALASAFEGAAPQDEEAVGLAWSRELVRQLRRGGVDAFHFYTLNRARPTQALCAALGIAESAAA